MGARHQLLQRTRPAGSLVQLHLLAGVERRRNASARVEVPEVGRAMSVDLRQVRQLQTGSSDGEVVDQICTSWDVAVGGI